MAANKRIREYQVTFTVSVELEPGDTDEAVIKDYSDDIPKMIGIEVKDFTMTPKIRVVRETKN